MATNPQRSLKSAVDLLTSTMLDPIKTDVCAMRLSLAADRIDQALEACTSVAEKIKIAKSYPKLLRAGIKFLTFKQPPPDHMTMVDRLVACHCDFGKPGMKSLHTPSRYRIDGLVQVDAITLVFDAVATVSNCLILALADLTQHKFRTGKADTYEQPWPQGPKDLLPLGPKDTLVGLELWVAAVPHGYIIYKLAGCLAKFYAPFAGEVFQSPHSTFALARPITHLQEVVKFYDEGDSSPLSRTHFFTYPVMSIFEFWEKLLHCDTPQFNIMFTGRHWISPILAHLTIILSTLPQEWSKTRTILQHITPLANAEVNPVTGVAMIKYERQLLTELPYFDKLENAFSVMVEARKMGCWNITCPSVPDAIHSRLCSKCNLIRFCGEKCQREAWKCANLPHKSVCAKIHSLKEVLGADDWSLIWTSDYTYAQFQVMCKVKKLDTNIITRIGSTISGLRFHQNVFLADTKKAGASQVDRLVRVEQEKSADQILKDLTDRLGDQLTVLDRAGSFSAVYGDAYN